MLLAIDNRATDASAVHEQGMNRPAVKRFAQEFGGDGDEPHGVARLLAGDTDRGYTRCVRTTPESEHTIVATTSRDVQSTYERLITKGLNST